MRKAFDEITADLGGEVEGVVYKRERMKTNYGDVLQFGPVLDVQYATGHGQALVEFVDLKESDAKGEPKVGIRIADQEFTYQDLVELLSFMSMVAGWLGRQRSKTDSNDVEK